MKYNDVIDRLQNLTMSKVNTTEIAEVLNIPVRTLYTRSYRNSEVFPGELKKLEEFYKVNLFKTDTQTQNIEISDDILLDYYPEVYASCGNGAEPFSTRSEKMNVSKALIKGYDSHKRYNVINTTSDSMMPEIAPKDFLIIETEPESIKDNHIYVFTYENEIYCKYLCRNLKEIIIRSANSLYNDVFLVGEERAKMKILGEVVAVIRDYTR